MNIGKMALLRNDNNKQVSPITEGFTEIRIIYTLQGKNLHDVRTVSRTLHTATFC
jgi:hypothetical protein